MTVVVERVPRALMAEGSVLAMATTLMMVEFPGPREAEGATRNCEVAEAPGSRGRLAGVKLADQPGGGVVSVRSVATVGLPPMLVTVSSKSAATPWVV